MSLGDTEAHLPLAALSDALRIRYIVTDSTRGVANSPSDCPAPTKRGRKDASCKSGFVSVRVSE